MSEPKTPEVVEPAEPATTPTIPWNATTTNILLFGAMAFGLVWFVSGKLGPVTPGPDGPYVPPTTSLRDQMPPDVANHWGAVYNVLADSLEQDAPNPTMPDRGKVYKTVEDFDTAQERAMTLVIHTLKLTPPTAGVSDEISSRLSAAVGGLENAHSLDEMDRRQNLVRVCRGIAYELNPSLVPE